MMSLQDPVQTLENHLGSGRSATAILQDFCATPLRVVQNPCQSFPFPEKLALLELPDFKQGQLSFRHIHLYADGHLLMEAWNCFNPSLLPSIVQKKLSESTVPFGALLGENYFRREALLSSHPSPLTPYVLAHQAILRRLNDQKPLALVYEHYTERAAQFFTKHTAS